MDRAVPGTQAVTRAIELLKRFDARHPTWRLTAIAQQARLHKATAHRLLAALESEGMLTRDPLTPDLYRLGPEAMALGAQALRTSELAERGHTELEILADATRETATLEVPVWPAMLIIDEVASRQLVSAQPSIGTRWPAYATSTGKAVLATLSPAAAERAAGARLRPLTGHTITSHAALARELADVRKRGWAYAHEELELQFAAVGAVVRAAAGRVVGAVSVGLPSSRAHTTRRVETLAHMVKLAASRISEALGWPALP